MRKLLVSLLAVASTASFAGNNNSEMQEFLNQASVGFGMNQTNASFGLGNVPGNIVTTGTMANLEAERLFNNGIYLDVLANMQFGNGPVSYGVNSPSYGVNGKVGYAFVMGDQHLLLAPYVLAGLNNNSLTMVNQGSSALAAGTVVPPGYEANAASANIANQFYYTGGIGGHLEYRINHTIDLFADQNVAYNWDQTFLSMGIQPQNFISYTSTLGARFNLAPNFQLGVKGFYTGYDNQASNTVYGQPAFAQNNSTIGGLVSVGVTY